MLDKAIEWVNSIKAGSSTNAPSIKLSAEQTDLLEWLHRSDRPAYEAATALGLSDARIKYEYGKLDRQREIE